MNTASITTSADHRPGPPNNSATDTDTVPQANLSITKTDSVIPVNPGQAFTYTLTVNNAGPSTATSIVVSDNVPSQFTVTSVTSPIGSCGNVGNAVTCTLASMSSGAPAWVITVNVTANANTPGGIYTNTATVSGAENDPTPGNNTANRSTTVRSWADLAISKTDGVASVTAGTSTTYTITVTNNGPTVEPAGVVISDTIPAGHRGIAFRARLRHLGRHVPCTTTTTLAVGASKSYQLTLAVAPDYGARHAHEYGDHHHVPAHRPGRREQHRFRHRHHHPVGRSVDHQDGRSGVRDRGDVDHLHGHRHEQRPFDRARGRGGLRHDPGRHHRYDARVHRRSHPDRASRAVQRPNCWPRPAIGPA